jgi:hypothetical protein
MFTFAPSINGRHLELELKKLVKWFDVNKLTINLAKHPTLLLENIFSMILIW